MMKTRTNEQVVNEHVSNEAKPQRDAAGAAGPESRPPEVGTPNSKALVVVYHRADFDGLFCREIARRFLGETAEYVGWDYGDDKIPFPRDRKVYVLDLSPECFSDFPEHVVHADNLIWIDHHKSAMEKFSPAIAGYRIDGVAACRLAWQWFNRAENPALEVQLLALPVKFDFVDRKVSEPYAVRLAGEYDIWDKRDTGVDILQLGLQSVAVDELDWAALLAGGRGVYVDWLMSRGRVVQEYQRGVDGELCRGGAAVVEFEGLKFLALNSPLRGSLQFAAKDVPETGHDALMKFNWNGQFWDVSLYHARHRTDLDLSGIAVKYGGGGHRGACGFVAAALPFVLGNHGKEGTNG